MHQPVCVSDATLIALEELLWQQTAIEPNEAAAGRVHERLLEIGASDSAFAAWYQHARSSSCSPAGNSPTGIAAGELEQLLLRYPSWHQGVDSTDDRRAVVKRLNALANLIVRHRAMQQAFNAAVAHEHMRATYNFAYGLSHELNNPLAIIATRAGVLLRDEPQAQRRHLLESIIDSAMRGCEMLGDLMLIARPPLLELQSICLRELINRIGDKTTQYISAREIDLKVDCAEVESAGILADDRALTEALWSLIRNAIEALTDGGSIRIKLRRSDQTYIVGIQDDGPGLSRAALESCFDPYFSGREAGRGLGIGLAKARRIVELHDGSVQLRNLATGGCEAIVRLPRHAV